MKQEFQDVVRYEINKFIFEQGYAPSVEELSEITQRQADEVKSALDELVSNHALVLHPDSYKIWIAHPFSLMPTSYWVESGDRGWYSNCTWCSLGVASLSEGEDVTIYTRLNGARENLEIHIRDNQVVEDHLLVHFVVPPRDFWHNVIYTCANMLPFDSEGAIEKWCHRHRVTKAEIQPISRVWKLARLWYGYYLSPQWTRKTSEQARELFKEAGLTGEFWRV